MSSLLALPLQTIGISCEILFLLERKLGDQGNAGTVPMAICEMVFEEVVNTVLGHSVPVGMFASRRPLTLQELRKFVFDILQNPSLKLDEDRCSKVGFPTKAKKRTPRSPMHCFASIRYFLFYLPQLLPVENGA
jgi:hypothetical protein